MQICDECLSLAGKESITSPHDNLRASGVGMFGGVGPAGLREVKLHSQWICEDCGTWMYQCTEHDTDSPGHWRQGSRPSDWPKGLPDIGSQ